MKAKIDIFIFADALGWNIASRRKFVEDLLPVRNRCETLLGYSSTCDPTILTGALPQDHGHFSFFVKAKENQSPFKSLRHLGFLPELVAGHHRVRNKVSKFIAARQGYTGYFQLYSVPFSKLPYLDYTEKKDIYEPGGINGGQRTIFEHWQESGKPWTRSNWRLSDPENIDHAKREIEKGDVELLYLFTARLDAAMHRYGTDHPQVDEAFDTFAKNLRSIADTAARHYQEVRLHLFSDHGMADVHQCSDLLPRWEKLGLKFGRDYTAVWDSTMARFWFADDSVRKTATTWLQEQKDGQVLTDEQLAGYGCLFPDRKFGELFYLLPSGSLFVPSFLNQRKVTAMHGYAPEHIDSAAAWMSSHETLPVQNLTQIFPVMRKAASS
ncbi:alkaline phosphatase family protein [Luteolibacter pohnpeiensis]|uniref:Alkaline phosphatase family protein n=1 Tax=Luteolibacter pohnpeiensis TaxID=454153 RepID=A0A934SAP3_9BACT|nr:alkaline phosphatase family protein [Luteolibacter pohnpeiensis]MBK1882429.1 alkaline phosphatase family protein [Luteolibacter pohnpeiensis]